MATTLPENRSKNHGGTFTRELLTYLGFFGGNGHMEHSPFSGGTELTKHFWEDHKNEKNVEY